MNEIKSFREREENYSKTVRGESQDEMDLRKCKIKGNKGRIRSSLLNNKSIQNIKDSN